MCSGVIAIKIITAGNIDREILQNLKKRGFDVIGTSPLESVLEPLKYHADMQIARFGGSAVIEPTLFDVYKDYFVGSKMRAVCGNTSLNGNYPGDVAYNISAVGEVIFHKTSVTDSAVTDAARDEKMIFADVAQGYSGCSICRIGTNAIITADVPIYHTAAAYGIEALLISPGNIGLDGFDTGFIGGCSFLYNGTVYFFGSLRFHPDRELITDFCRQCNTEICELSEMPLTDYGSAVVIE